MRYQFVFWSHCDEPFLKWQVDFELISFDHEVEVEQTSNRNIKNPEKWRVDIECYSVVKSTINNHSNQDCVYDIKVVKEVSSDEP